MGNWLLSEKTCKQRLDTNDFERIWKIISSVPTNQLLRNRHYHRLSTKSCSHDLFDFNYAGYIRNHLMNVGNTRDIDFWDGLKTSRPKIYSRTWKLTPTSSIHSTDPTPLLWQELFKTRFKAFKKIVNYCNSNKRNKHRPILGQVDFVLTDDCHVTICPICVALNLWIKHVQIYPYREGITIPRYHYNFLDWLWCYDFFEPEALTHFDTFSSESYLTNKELICLAYERDLLFCFAEILTVIQTIGEDTALWNRQSSVSDSVTRKIRELRKRYLSDFIYAKDDDLYIHYAIRSPLDLVDAQPRASISNCRMWRTQIRKTQEVEARDARLRYADSLPTEKRYLDYEIEMQTAYVPDHEKKWFALDMMRWFENYQRLYHEKMALQS